MYKLNERDILTKVTRYNLIRSERMIYIDVHETIAGNLAGKFVAVPNIISIIAEQKFQGAGNSEEDALKDCLEKIDGLNMEEIFPQ